MLVHPHIMCFKKMPSSYNVQFWKIIYIPTQWKFIENVKKVLGGGEGNGAHIWKERVWSSNYLHYP